MGRRRDEHRTGRPDIRTTLPSPSQPTAALQTDRDTGRPQRPQPRRPKSRDSTPGSDSEPDSGPERRRQHAPNKRRRLSAPTEAALQTRIPASLPYDARQLVRADLSNFHPLLAYYLRVQKQRDLSTMDELEVRGRWKTFRRRWNRAELAEGWYDPDIFALAASDSRLEHLAESGGASGPSSGFDRRPDDGDDDNTDSEIGPAMPASPPDSNSFRGEPHLADGADRVQDLRAARRADRREQRERLDELVPRADAGTHERRVERRREETARRHERERSPGGVGAVAEADLMGGAGVAGEEFARIRSVRQRRRTEREVRREEAARDRLRVLELRLEGWRRREHGTISMLQELARQRFG